MPRWLAVLVCVLAACGSSEAEPSSDAGAALDAITLDDATLDARGADAGEVVVPIERPALPAANAVTSEDPTYPGQLRFLWDTWANERNDDWPPAAFMASLWRDDRATFGEQFASFGFLVDPNDDLPVGLKRGIDDPTRVGTTCAICHVARLSDGRIWLGAANLELDLARFRVEVSRRWEMAGHPPLVSAMELAKSAHLGPGRTSAEGDANPNVVPVDFPPYYNFQERTAFNYLGAMVDLRSMIFMSVFDTGAAMPFDRTAAAPWPGDRRVGELVDFLGTLRGPPGLVRDPGLVAAGEAIFARERCGSCHHVDMPALDRVVPYATDGVERLPGDDAEYPDGSIATDRALLDLLDEADDRIAARFEFIARKRLSTRLSDGYRALGLRSVWASPPYLHNGSVPTLDALLRPVAERPATFMRGDYVVDTSAPGSSHRGHEFATSLTDEERAQLVAYLESL